MKSRKDLKIYTLRNSLFYIGIAAAMGAVIGAAAGIMDWSTGVVYAVGLPTALVIGLMSIRESLFAPPQQPKQQRHGGHA